VMRSPKEQQRASWERGLVQDAETQTTLRRRARAAGREEIACLTAGLVALLALPADDLHRRRRA